jgi:hypothetical protein
MDKSHLNSKILSLVFHKVTKAASTAEKNTNLVNGLRISFSAMTLPSSPYETTKKVLFISIYIFVHFVGKRN